MHDQFGNPDHAPLEILNRQLIAAKGPEVVKFSITGSEVPPEFVVEYVPKIFRISRDGEKALYDGDPSNLVALKNFALTA